MSDEKRIPGESDEELLRLLADLEQDRAIEGTGPAEPAPGRRAYLELLGLVGQSVAPLAPSPALERRLMDSLPGAAAAGAPPVPAARPAPGARWLLPLAATLALALGGFSLWQASRISEQGETIERLTRRLQEVEARAPAVAGMRGQLGELQARLAMLTDRGTEICLLRPMAAAASADSRGVLFVAADHQHWYLALEGLAPCAEGRSYQLWFVPADGQPVSAGTFDVVPGMRVELSSAQMPAGTRAVTVTLEPAGGSESPTGPAVLHGDEVMAIL